MRGSGFLGGWALVYVAGCASGGTPRAEDKPTAVTTSPAPGLPPAVLAALAREVDPLPTQKVVGPGFVLEVEATELPPVEPAGPNHQVTVNIGTQGRVQCIVYGTPLDYAGAIGQMLKAIQPQVKVRKAVVTDVQLVDEIPALFSNVEYTTLTDGKKVLGQLKLMVHVRGDSSLMCMHDEPGYQASFRRMGLVAAKGFLPDGWKAPPLHYVETQVVKIGTSLLGFVHHVCGREGATTTCEGTDALLVPRGPGSWMTSDSASVEVSDAAGVVTTQTVANAEAGELSSRMTIRKTAPGAYDYEGTMSGKDLKGSFKTKSPTGIISEPALRALTLDVVQKQTRADVERYVNSLAPDVATPMTVSPTSKPSSVVVEMVGRSVVSDVDADGLGSRSEIRMGQMVMSFERVYVRGLP